MKLFNKFVYFGFLLVMLCILNGCNTVQGVGKDVSATGHAISHAANDAQ